MGLYNARFEDVVEFVNLCNHEHTLNLEFRGASDRRAAWLVANCAITAIKIVEITRVELDDFSCSGKTADARQAATKLFRHLNAHFAEIDPREYPDEMERIANNTLARMKSRDNFDYAQILARADLDAEARAQIEARRDARDAHERERARRNQLTAAAWLEEFFGADEPRAARDTDATKEQTTRASKGGRPRNSDDDWAWEQVNRLKRDRTTVYSEWRARIGERDKMLADSQDSFNKAVSARRKEKTEKTE